MSLASADRPTSAASASTDRTRRAARTVRRGPLSRWASAHQGALLRHHRLLATGVVATPFALVGATVAVDHWTGVDATSCLGVAVGLGMGAFAVQHGPLRHCVRFAWHLRQRLEYRRAGCTEATTAAWLWAAGIDPRQVKALLNAGHEQGDLTEMSLHLVDRPWRDAGLAVQMMLSAPHRPLRLVIGVLDHLADAADRAAAGASGDLAGGADGADPCAARARAAVEVMSADQVSDAYVILLLGSEMPAALAVRVGARLSPAGPLQTLGRLWAGVRHLPEAGAALSQWAEVDPSGFTWWKVDEVEAWVRLAGADGAWWHHAGFTSQDAQQARQAGAMPDRETLRSYGALRDQP